MPYSTRQAESLLKRYLNAFPVVGMTGPRQSGKSTLAQHALPDYTYVTFDDLQSREFFIDDPQGFMQFYHDRVIFDEVQNVPEIFSMLKYAVDQDRAQYGKFILTGSCQFNLLNHISDSLAGRIGLMSLLPYQYSELPLSAQQQVRLKGAYPEIVERDYTEYELWYSAYIETYLNRDVRLLSQIGDMRDFQRFIMLLAANAAQQMNYSHYAHALGVSVPTIKRWLSILEASYIIFLLPPYFNNYNKRIVKSPKLYFYDNGLVTYLMGIKTQEQLLRGPMAGALFENFVIAELIKKERHVGGQGQFYYYRTSQGQEIDLIIHRGQRKDLFEIKQTQTFKSAMVQHLSLIKEEQDESHFLYCGKTLPPRQDVQLINYAEFLLTRDNKNDVSSI